MDKARSQQRRRLAQRKPLTSLLLQRQQPLGRRSPSDPVPQKGEKREKEISTGENSAAPAWKGRGKKGDRSKTPGGGKYGGGKGDAKNRGKTPGKGP
eukprot:12890290-Prorocentrum_lima.AAC.1